MSEKFSRKKYFIIYTLVFAAMAVLVFLPFKLTGKSFVWNADSKDGLVQHYNALMYYGKALRETAKILLQEHRLVLPEYSFSLGMGSDVLKTLHYYVIGDPLNLLSALVPAARIYQLYSALIVARLYLAGLSFSVFAIGRKQLNTAALLAGSMVYAFCGYAMMAGVKHPYFINPMIYLPLILLGVHIYLEKKRPFLYIISVAVAALSNFYFLYMIVIVTAIYIVFTLIESCRDSVKEFARSLAGLVISSLIAAAMSAVILIPVVSGYLGDSRTQSSSVIETVYHQFYYRGLAGQFVAFGSVGYWTYMVYGLMTLAAVFVLFRKKGNTKIKLLFILGVIFLLVPYAGYMMNGFSYIVNRWCFAFSFLCAYILVKMWPELFSLSRREKTILAVFLLVYVCAEFTIKPADYIPAFGLVCAIGMGGILLLFLAGEEKGKKVSRGMPYLVLASVLLSILGNAYYCYHPDQSDFLEEFCDVEYMRTIKHGRYPDATILKLEQKNGESILSRYSGEGFQRNSSLRYGTSTTQYFWSLSNPYVAQLRTDLLLSEDKPQVYTGFDDSTFQNALAGVAYHVTKDEDLVPYGYQLAAEVGPQLIYHNRFALPVLYAYDSYITHKEYDALTAVQKSEAMMQGVLLETEEPELLRADLVLTSHDVSFEVQPGSDRNVVFHDNTFSVLKPNASIKIRISGEADTETIFCLGNARYRGVPELDLYSDDTSVDPENRYGQEEYDNLDGLQKRKLEYSAKTYNEPDKIVLQFEMKRDDGSAVDKKLQLAAPNYAWYCGREDYTLNFGYSKEPVKELTITFPIRGVYSFDEIGFTAQPMDNYEAQVTKLARNAAENIQFKDNVLTANVHLEQTACLCMAIPYDKGWTAYADGKQVQLQQANTAYMGVILRAGDHDIKLVYHTPYLRPAAAISTAGWFLFILLIPLYLYRRKHRAAD